MSGEVVLMTLLGGMGKVHTVNGGEAAKLLAETGGRQDDVIGRHSRVLPPRRSYALWEKG
jgi:hypothetical protein